MTYGFWCLKLTRIKIYVQLTKIYFIVIDTISDVQDICDSIIISESSVFVSNNYVSLIKWVIWARWNFTIDYPDE